MGNKTMRTNNTGSIPLCEKLDTKRRNVKEAHTQREQGGQADHIKHVPGNGKGAYEVKMASERTWAEPCSHAVTCLQEQDPWCVMTPYTPRLRGASEEPQSCLRGALEVP